MKDDETLYGFRIKKSTEIAEIKATLFEGEHIKSGAKFFFLDREDENKTFAITFKTIPEDSTGVFHIIEHSVLNGSRKFKTKEPFVDLLKSSLYTFLNAMTFPDKTMYPVSSRNDRDFFNLTDVYLDAVFHPSILENEKVFSQEGWHYEYDREKDELSRTGVVLSEMQGAFSSADDLASFHINEMLYPDSPYRFDSGGEPSEITKLTYEEFCRGHKKFYHPSNAEIFLDGSVNLSEILPLLDSYLSEYERQTMSFDIPDQPPISPVRREIEYEISDTESKENKTRLVLGYFTGRFDDRETSVGLSVLIDAIASSNDSPLKKAILDSGLCEDMSFIPTDSIKENSMSIDFINVKDGCCEQLYGLFVESLKRIASEGIDKNALFASMNNLEFRVREKDFGTTPSGIIYAMALLESSLYGGDAAMNLSYEKPFSAVRKKIGSDYFEELIKRIFIENTHRATLVMNPSPTLGKTRLEREREELAKIRASLSEAELEAIEKKSAELAAWQSREDTEEELATIPRLELRDLSAEIEWTNSEEKEILGVTVINQKIATGGIIYSDLCFDVSDLDPEEIFDLGLLISFAENLPTEKHTASELQNIIKANLGSFSMSVSPLRYENKDIKNYFIVGVSLLEANRMAVPEIIEEILYTTVYKNKEAIQNVVRQIKISGEEAFISNGHLAAFRRASAYTDSIAAIKEYFSGYEAHTRVRELEKNFDAEFEKLEKRLAKLSKKIFSRERLLLSATGNSFEDFERAVIESVRHGEPCRDVTSVKPLGIRREGIIIPANTAYTALAGNLYELGVLPYGGLNVVRSMLSYEYLWSAVRVQGGAYGVGFLMRNDGNAGFYSYRDPSPKRTHGCYGKASDFLYDFVKSEYDITKFIIGALGDSSPLTTPRLKGTIATTRYLKGLKYEDVKKIRLEILSASKEDLLKTAEIIEKITRQNAFCAVGGREKLCDIPEIETLLDI